MFLPTPLATLVGAQTATTEEMETMEVVILKHL
jgi:hypothetical protein